MKPKFHLHDKRGQKLKKEFLLFNISDRKMKRKKITSYSCFSVVTPLINQKQLFIKRRTAI